MLRVSRHTYPHRGWSLQKRREIFSAVQSALWCRRSALQQQLQQHCCGVPAPHARPLSYTPSGTTAVARGLVAWHDRRRGSLGFSPFPLSLSSKRPQLRALASGGGGGGGGKGAKQESKRRADGQEEDALFGNFRKTLQEELDKNPSLKENLAKIKEAEKKLGEETKNRVKNLQGEAEKYASTASEKAQKAGGLFQERIEDVKKTLKEKLGNAGGAGDGDKEGAGGQEAENEFVRASKEKFSETQKALDENSAFVKIKTSMQKFREGFSSASAELFGSKGGEKAERKESAVVKKLKQPKVKKQKTAADGSKDGVGKEGEGKEEEEEEEEEDKGGVGSLMIVKSAGEAWKRLQERLKEAPIIQELLGASRVVAKGSVGRGAKAATDAVKDKVEDVQEAWETSQHPLVYKVSSAWDSVTAESELGVGVRELRRLDPSFTLEDWKSAIQEDFLPDFMSAFLRGDAEELKLWTGEACYNKLASEIRQRKADGMVLDPHVLDVRQGEVVTIKADAAKANPTVAFQFMCQQINCVRNTKGEVIDGSEDDIRATYYMLAFQREFSESDAELRWKVVDMMVIGAFPWY